MSSNAPSAKLETSRGAVHGARRGLEARTRKCLLTAALEQWLEAQAELCVLRSSTRVLPVPLRRDARGCVGALPGVVAGDPLLTS